MVFPHQNSVYIYHIAMSAMCLGAFFSSHQLPATATARVCLKIVHPPIPMDVTIPIKKVINEGILGASSHES